MKDNLDRSFKLQFSTSNNIYSNLKFSKSTNYFKPKTEVAPIEQNIYYDEVVYYDGGDVKGYGYEK